MKIACQVSEPEENVLELGDAVLKLAEKVPKLGDAVPKREENRGKFDENHGKLAVKVLELEDAVPKLGENHGEVGENPGSFAVKVPDVDGTVRDVRDYSLDDLVRLSGYSARCIRHYIQLGLLARPKNAARATRYSRETLGRLAAIRHLRALEGLSVNQVKRAVRALAPDEVSSWANQLHPDPAMFPKQPSPLVAAPPHPTTNAPSLVTAERWVRVPIVPGLDLVLREGAGDDVVRLAKDIQATHSVTVKA